MKILITFIWGLMLIIIGASSAIFMYHGITKSDSAIWITVYIILLLNAIWVIWFGVERINQITK